MLPPGTRYKLVRPEVLLFVIGAGFYGALNLIFKFHLAADDFDYLGRFWAHVDTPSLDAVIGPVVFRQPIFLLQYLLIRLDPLGTNALYFVFQLVHAVNAALVCRLVAVHISPL